ncbi:MAG TPA: LysM peptidoglycan-binding domain-containing protein [Acidimicrobiales bacterium]|nr:LysM peptidoglycan-binding domain-containing protein [Acidimicrobiales bacterium]
MAIAPLPDVDLSEVPWPRPVLRLVEPLTESHPTVEDLVWGGSGDAGRAIVDVAWDAGDGSDAGNDEAFFVATDPDELAVRRVRVSARVRRRRLALGALVVGLLVALAFPISALGGQPVPAASAAGTSGAGTVYVVQPGDTLWSIASRIDGNGNPRPLVEALTAKLGSATVVPGEHIDIP